MAQPNGYIMPSSKPAGPVEWTVFDGGGVKNAGGTTDRMPLFEIDCTGFDSYGFEATVVGQTSSDSTQIYIVSPNGSNLANIYASGSTLSNAVSAVSTQLLEVFVPRLRVEVETSNWSGPPSDITVLVQVYMRRAYA